MIVAFEVFDHGRRAWLSLLSILILHRSSARIPSGVISGIELPPLLHEFDHGIVRIIVIVPSRFLYVSLIEQFGSASFVGQHALSANELHMVGARFRFFASLCRAPVDVQQLVEEGGGLAAEVRYVLLPVWVFLDFSNRVLEGSQVVEELLAKYNCQVRGVDGFDGLMLLALLLLVVDLSREVFGPSFAALATVHGRVESDFTFRTLHWWMGGAIVGRIGVFFISCSSRNRRRTSCSRNHRYGRSS